MSIAVVVPSRGRPRNIVELCRAWHATASGRAELFIVVDDDDVEEPEYNRLETYGATMMTIERRRLGGTLNYVVPILAKRYDIVGFMGDDHRPRTLGWDGAIEANMQSERWETMEGATGLIPGASVVYGNDLVHGANLPTAVFMDARIVRTLGHFVLPGQTHLFMDNYWKTLGEQLGTLRYLPDVVIEHCHPVAGKAEWDAGYEAANSAANWENDERIYKEWVATQMPADIAKVKAALA